MYVPDLPIVINKHDIKVQKLIIMKLCVSILYKTITY